MKDQARKYGVCDLELSKKLKELGYPQKGLWWWHYYNPCSKDDPAYDSCGEYQIAQAGNVAVAPTVAELGEKLFNIDYTFAIGIEPSSKEIIFERHHRGTGITKNIVIMADTEANARAKCLIYLIEKGLKGRQPWHNISGLNNGEPWNKGKKENRAEIIDKLRKARLGKTPWNKGKKYKQHKNR